MAHHKGHTFVDRRVGLKIVIYILSKNTNIGKISSVDCQALVDVVRIVVRVYLLTSGVEIGFYKLNYTACE